MRFVDLKTAIRPINSLMAAIAVYIGASIAANGLVFSFPVFLAVIAAFLIASAGQSVNDYYDFAIDYKHGPKYKHLTEENKHHLLILSAGLFAAGNVAAFFAGILPFKIAVIISVLLIAYSAVLSKYKYVGNVVVALGTALPLVFGAAIFQRFDVVIWLATSAFFANWAREIVKDCQDITKDKGAKKTLPMVLTVLALQIVVSILIGLAAISAFVPLSFGIYGNTLFLIFVLVAILLFYYAFWQFFLRQFKESQSSFKKAMLFALAGFLLGIL
ncbi:MAG: UbiA family prenyltransferase [Candidatus Micrarchaeota archaeon]